MFLIQYLLGHLNQRYKYIERDYVFAPFLRPSAALKIYILL